jgi:hypothetical protein
MPARDRLGYKREIGHGDDAATRISVDPAERSDLFAVDVCEIAFFSKVTCHRVLGGLVRAHQGARKRLRMRDIRRQVNRHQQHVRRPRNDRYDSHIHRQDGEA